MAYSRVPWANGEAPAINQTNLKNFNTGIEQNNLFNLLLTTGRYKVTEFDTPLAGSITESIKLTVNDSVYATIVTEFDTPAIGSITETLTCTDLGLSSKVVTEFDTPTVSDITETSSVYTP